MVQLLHSPIYQPSSSNREFYSSCSNWINSSVLTKPVAFSSNLLPLKLISHTNISSYSSVIMELWSCFFFLTNWLVFVFCLVFFNLYPLCHFTVSNGSRAKSELHKAQTSLTALTIIAKINMLIQQCFVTQNLSTYFLSFYWETITTTHVKIYEPCEKKNPII